LHQPAPLGPRRRGPHDFSGKGEDMNILYTKAAHRHHPLKQPA
jgi:hypothetical protein